MFKTKEKFPHLSLSITWIEFEKVYCAVQNTVLNLNNFHESPKRSAFWLGALFLAVLLSGCSSSGNSRNVPVVRLPAAVQYSQDPRFYIVRPGDTLYSIAWQLGLDYRVLADKNNIGNKYKIKPGQKLVVKFEPVKIAKKTIPPIPKSRKITSNKNRNLKPEVKVISQVKTPKLKRIIKNHVTKWSWPVNGMVVSKFSSSRGGNKGIDIATTGSQPVRAVADGVVVYSGNGLRGYGRLVIIKHNDDYLSAYAYNQRIRVKEKKQVKVGEIIADTGVNGLFKNRLHLEFRYKGKPVNPLKFLKP